MLETTLGLALLALGGVAFIGAAVTAGVLARLLRRGPEAAREAYVRGDSTANWWHAQQPLGREKLGLGERCALAGRVSDDMGIVAVEERASHSTYAR